MIAAAPRILKIYPAFFVSESMLSTELKSQIQGAYSRFLEAKSLKPRYGQRLMIAEIAKVLGTITVSYTHL